MISEGAKGAMPAAREGRTQMIGQGARRAGARLWVSSLLMSLSLAWTAGAAPLDAESREPGDEALYVSSSEAPTGDLAPDAVIVRAGRRLSIAEAVALSIKNNLNVEVERFAPLIAESDYGAAWGAYDPVLSGDAGYEVTKAPVTFLSAINPIRVNRSRIAGGGVGIDQLVPWVGASIGLRFEGKETETRSQIQSLNPQYDSSLFLTAKIPLMRNLIWNQAWTQVKTSRILVNSARADFTRALMDTVQSTADRYWALVAARDQVRVAQKSLETARALLDQTRTQFEVGVVSRVEVVEAEAGVADREFGLISAANSFRNAQDILIDTVLGDELDAMSDLQFELTEDPAAYRVRNVSVDEAVKTAFRLRPELDAARRRIEQNEIELKFAKNQRLPQLDAELRAGFVGVSGDERDGVNDLFGQDFSDSTDDFLDNEGSDNYRVIGRFSIPIPNTAARRRVEREKFDLRRSKTQRLRVEQTIVLEVRGAARTLLASSQGIDAAERRRLAAEEQLRAERIRLEHGESTPFEVLQRESDLVEAESQKIAALRTYRSAEAALERAQGTILGFHDVIVGEASEPVR